MGRDVGDVGLGAWQLGADWGEVSEDDALATLAAAVESGATFIDTADVYGDGRSERLIGRFLRAHDGPPARSWRPRWAAASRRCRRTTRPRNFRAWTDRSRANLGVDTLDLVQLHCPPTPVFADDAVFDALDDLVGAEADRGVRRQRGDLRRGAGRDRPARTWRQRADHPQRVPPQAARAGAAGGGRGGRRHHRPGAAGQRAALRPVRREHHVPAPTTTATTTGTARRSTSARRSPASTSAPASRRSAGCARWCRRARRWRSSRCAGSSTSPASRW